MIMRMEPARKNIFNMKLPLEIYRVALGQRAREEGACGLLRP